MVRKVECKKLKKISDGLDFPPYPGDLGKKIYKSISKEAWKEWIKHQTILINEYRLSSLDSKAKEFLKLEMVKFLFDGQDLEKPEKHTLK